MKPHEIRHSLQQIENAVRTLRLALPAEGPANYYAYARSLIGLAEVPGPDSDPRILAMIREWLPDATDDSTISWCGAFVAHVLARFDLSVAREPLVARSWRSVFPAVTGPPEEGDLVVLWRESPTSWKGHVGFWAGAREGVVLVLGGNQSNKVSVAPFPESRILGVYRPAA